MRDIVYVSSLTAGEPLEKGRYFTGLTKLRRWLESGGAPFAGYRNIFHLYTHRGIPDYREYPDLLVRLRRSLHPRRFGRGRSPVGPHWRESNERPTYRP